MRLVQNCRLLAALVFASTKHRNRPLAESAAILNYRGGRLRGRPSPRTAPPPPITCDSRTGGPQSLRPAPSHCRLLASRWAVQFTCQFECDRQCFSCATCRCSACCCQLAWAANRRAHGLLTRLSRQSGAAALFAALPGTSVPHKTPHLLRLPRSSRPRCLPAVCACHATTRTRTAPRVLSAGCW
jgi:hypothetical protein